MNRGLIANESQVSIHDLMRWGSASEVFVLLNSCTADLVIHESGSKYHWLAAKGSANEFHFPSGKIASAPFPELKNYIENKQGGFVFGILGYDLKNGIEMLTSANTDHLFFPDMLFFTPQLVAGFSSSNEFEVYEKNKKLNISAGSIFNDMKKKPEKNLSAAHAAIVLSPGISKTEYLKLCNKIAQHIQHGDIYELNYCTEFFNNNITVDPYAVFIKICETAPAPFSCLVKIHDKFLICASPERYLAKRKNKIFSQPVKGTIKRGNSPEEDQQLKEKLLNSEKDRSENVMIVDLVRNDLSKVAEKGSVNVDELFGIYSFSHVHQMISTVSCDLRSDLHPVDAIKATFPMGSMTGAPKVKAMQLIEQYENFKRGIFSGSVGYFSPDGDFDFNVVIRSIMYNSTNKYLSVRAGSAITANSDPEKEYEECILKAKPLADVLGAKIISE